MKNLFIKSLIISTLSISLFSCKKSTEEVAPAIAASQPLSLNITNLANSKGIDFTNTFTTPNGERYNISSFRYYVSKIRLVKQDGSEYAIAGKYLLVNPSTPTYALGNVPTGDYKSIKFGIGIDSLTNHSDPTIHQISNPLAIQSPGIHWSWKSGYIFLMLEGSCDTTEAKNDVQTYGQFSKPLTFHIGTDMMYREVVLSSNFTVGEGGKELKLEANLDAFFKNIDLKKENVTHSMGAGAALAKKAADNSATMFAIKN